MKVADRISLVWRYGRLHFLLGAVYDVLCILLLISDFSYSFFVDAFILKALFTAITMYLVNMFQNKDSIFFYINLGLSKRKLQMMTITADFLLFAVLQLVVLLIYG